MDFLSILDRASKNVKKSNHKLSEVDGEVKREKSKEYDKIRREKEEKWRREEAIRRKKEEERREQERRFQIPKKNKDHDESAVDKSKVQAFLARKEEEKRRQEKLRAAEKEQLIKLRLEKNGGKANKKIARHFGADVLDLQVKYGSDRDHIDTLVKYKDREQEEAEKLAAHYRNGVEKAFVLKRKMEDKAKTGEHRVKDNRAPKKSLTVVANDGFESNPKVKTDVNRKRPAAEALDFASLMQKAAKVANGVEDVGERKEMEGEEKRRARFEKQSMSKSSSSQSSSVSFAKGASAAAVNKLQNRPVSQMKIPPKSDPRTKAPYLPHGLLKKKEEEETLPYGAQKPQTCKRTTNPKPENRISSVSSYTGASSSSSFTPTPSVPFTYPVDERGKRILPGDIRYKDWLEKMKAEGKSIVPASKPPPSAPSKTTSSSFLSSKNLPIPSKNRDPPNSSKKRDAAVPSKSREVPSSSNRPTSSSSSSSKNHSKISSNSYSQSQSFNKMKSNDGGSSSKSLADKREKMMRMEEERRREERRQREKAKERREWERKKEMYSGRSSSSAIRGYDDDSDGDDREEEDDGSDLDSFIDDSGDLDDLAREDFEETLKSINKNYDKKRWKMNERMIDERAMSANWRTIEKEERVSARAGLKEDLREALKGKSEAL